MPIHFATLGLYTVVYSLKHWTDFNPYTLLVAEIYVFIKQLLNFPLLRTYGFVCLVPYLGFLNTFTY